MDCPECGTQVDSDASPCPSCGTELGNEQSEKNGISQVARRDAVATIRSQSERDETSDHDGSTAQSSEDDADDPSTGREAASQAEVTVWYPEPGLVKTPLQVGLWVLVLLTLSGAIGLALVMASLLIVVVLYGGLALVRLYTNLIEPNPRRFEDPEAFLEFVIDREREDPNWKLGGVLAVIGLILTVIGWGNMVSAVSGFSGSLLAGSPSAGGAFLGAMFWFLFLGAGIDLLARGCDWVVVGVLQLWKVKAISD